MKKLLFILLCIPFFVFSQTEKRLALVIGNANYNDNKLNNPVNDALLIAKTLEKLDFDVVLGKNISTRREFIEKIREFGNQRDNYDVGFVYYAGHAIQIGEVNYLLPTKQVFQSEDDVIDYAVNVQTIMKYLTGMTDQVNVLILDACRDNKFEDNWKPKNRGNNTGGGLAKIKPPTGSLIAFSTDAGETADDGDGKNSIYSESLSKHMLIENTSLLQMFKNVRAEVLKASNDRQSPVEENKLLGAPFYLIVKKDPSIIEIKILENEAKKEKDKGNLEGSLDKYTVLEIYLKTEIDDLEQVMNTYNVNVGDLGDLLIQYKKKLSKVYLAMGRIYWQIYEYKPSKYFNDTKDKFIASDQWTEEAYNRTYEEYQRLYNKYLANSSRAFLSAKILLGDIGFNTQENKNDYSESFYKYLRTKSYLGSDSIDSTFFTELNLLNKFNQENFGDKDFRTACSHYLTGVYTQKLNPGLAYKKMIISTSIFSKCSHTKEYINNYALSLSPVYPYKWTIQSFNTLLDTAFNDYNKVDISRAKNLITSLKKNYNSSMDSLYIINKEIINKGIETSKSNNNEDLEGMYSVAGSFYHNFPIIMHADNEITNERYLECFHATIKYRNLLLDGSYQDSIAKLQANAVTYSNLRLIIDDANVDSLNKIDKSIYNLYDKALKIAKNHKDGAYFLWMCNHFLESYYNDHSETSLYTYKDIVEILNTVDGLFPSIIQRYKCEDESSILEKYFDRLTWLDKNNLLPNSEIVSNIKRQSETYFMLFPEKE